MCLAIPGKIIKINKTTVIVDYGVQKREANTSLIDGLKIGEYVLVNAGFVIERVPEEQALKSIKAWEDAGRKNE